jgi:hypothetical protein
LGILLKNFEDADLNMNKGNKLDVRRRKEYTVYKGDEYSQREIHQVPTVMNSRLYY